LSPSFTQSFSRPASGRQDWRDKLFFQCNGVRFHRGLESISKVQ